MLLTHDEVVKKWKWLEETECISGCDDGWADILDEMCSKIAHLLSSLGLTFDVFKIGQYKEKFGELRVYPELWLSEEREDHNEIFKNICAIVDEAENKSKSICEVCGATGKMRPRGWAKTLCDKCYKKD